MNDTRRDTDRQDQEERLAAIASHYGVLVTRRGIRIPCPAHKGSDPNCAVWVAEKGYVRAYCHSEKCAFRDLAAGILAGTGVSIYPSSGPPGRRPNKNFETARYFHPDGKPRISYRKDYPFDFPPGPCTYRASGVKVDCGRTEPHKHPWTNKGATYAGVHPKLWGEAMEGSSLVLAEGEKAARALQDAGYTAVSLYGGAHHADKADYGMFVGRPVVVWPDQDNAGEGFAATVSYQLGQAGVSELRFVGVDQQPKGDAADVDPDRRAEILADVLAGPPTPPAKTLPRARATEDEQEVGMFGDLAPGGDASRYLDRYASVTVVKRYEQMDGPHEATKAIAGILNTANGLWTFDETTIDYKVQEQALAEWKSVRDSLSPRPDAYTQRRLAYLGQITTHPGPARGRIPVMAGLPGAPDYSAVTFAHEVEFDQPGRYIGCANGVVDLASGRLLPPDTGRRCLVTRSTGIEYHEDATHELVTRLFDHLDDDSKDYLLSALGRALWGVPDNTFVLILGPTKAGKTTLMAAVGSAIGGYFGSMNIDALSEDGRKGNAKSAHTEARRALFDKRIVSVPEAERGWVSTAALKALTDGAELQPERGIWGRSKDKHVTGTMFISANAAPRLGLAESAIRTRFRAVEYPSVPVDKRDPRVKAAFTSGTRNVQAAEAMLALLVRYAGLYPPGTELPVPPSVLAFTESQVDNAFTDFERWLQDRIAYVRGRRLAVNDVWEAWAREKGQDTSADEIGGQKRQGLPDAIVRSSNVVPGLPAVRRARFGSGQWGWVDYARVTPGLDDVGQGQRMDMDQGVCEELIDGKPCSKPTRNVAAKRCEDCVERLLPSDGGAEMGERPLDAGLQIRLADIALVQEELKAEPERVAFLEMQARAFRSLRSAAPDGILTPEALALLGGVEDVLSIIEQCILWQPSLQWERFNWTGFLSGWHSEFMVSLEPSRPGWLERGKALLQQRLLQQPLELDDEGAPA